MVCVSHDCITRHTETHQNCGGMEFKGGVKETGRECQLSLRGSSQKVTRDTKSQNDCESFLGLEPCQETDGCSLPFGLEPCSAKSGRSILYGSEPCLFQGGRSIQTSDACFQASNSDCEEQNPDLIDIPEKVFRIIKYKKLNRSRKQRMWKRFQPHAGMSSHYRGSEFESCPSEEPNGESWMHSLLAFKEECQKMSLTSDILEPFEDVLFFVGTLMGIDNSASALCALLAFVKARTKRSVLQTLESYLRECIAEFEPQSGEKQNNRWLDLIRTVRSDWSMACKSPMWRHLSTLLGIIVSVGICNASHLTFSLGNFEVCRPALLETHRSAFDMFDAVLCSITYFVENCAICWKTKTLRPLLFGQLNTFEEDYHNVVVWWDLVQNGNLLRQEGVTEAHFKTTLRSVGARMRELRETTKGIERTLVENKLLKLAHIEADYTTMKVGAGIRTAPFVYELYGASNQGKSTVMATIDNVLLASEGLCTDDEFKRSLNVAEKYFSGWRTDMLVMRLDDFCNTKPQFVDHAPTETLLRVANNVPFSAPMADLHQKGRVFVEPEIVPITTNKKDLDAGKYSCNPYSIQRRANIVITVYAREHLQRIDVDTGLPCGLDPSRVAEWYASIGKVPPEIEDLWVFDVERPVAPENETVVASYEAVYSDDGEQMLGIDIYQLLAYLTREFKAHRLQQAALVERHKKVQKGITFCDGSPSCKFAKGCCAIHDFPSTFGDSVPATDTPSEQAVEDDDNSDVSGFPSYTDSDFVGDATSATSIMSGFPSSAGSYSGNDEASEVSDEIRLNSAYDVLHGVVSATNVVANPIYSVEPHFGEKTFAAYTNATEKVSNCIARDSDVLARGVDAATASALIVMSSAFVKYWSWTMLVPTGFYERPAFQALFLMANWRTMHQLWMILTGFNIVTIIFALCAYGPYSIRFYLILAMCACFQCNISSLVRAYLLNKLRNSDCLPAIVRKYRDEHIGTALRYVAGFSVIYMLIRFYRRWRKDHLPHSFMNPTPEEIKERDNTPDVYAKLHKERIVYASDIAKTVDYNRLMATLKKNLMYAELCTPEQRTYVANVLFITSNVMLVPRHYFEHSRVFEVFLSKENTGRVGGNFRTQLHADNVVHIPDTDFSLAYCSTGGSFRDLTKHFPIAHLKDMSKFVAAWRKESGETLDVDGTACFARVHNNAKHEGKSFPSFHGGYYADLSHDTFFGMCGMPIVVTSTTPVIAGFHLGGKAGSKEGCFGTLTQDQLNAAQKELLQGLTRMRPSQDSGLPEQIMQAKYLVDADVRKKSPMNFLPHGAQFRYFGPCVGAVTNKSLVVDQVISPSIALECASPNKYRGPKLSPSWWPWQQCLANVATPAIEFEESLLERCASDYVDPLVELVRGNIMWQECEPLSEKQNINGIPGVKFIDAMKINTSVGFPLSGKKSQFIENPEDVGNRCLTTHFRDEVARVEALFATGNRANIPAKACVKMEVHTKEKARIFYSCPMVLVYITRKYFLPITRLMQMYPALSECAVGINAHSQEWEYLINHAVSKGKDRIVAGDYSKYDQKLSSQLISTALNCLIEIARHMNYTAYDISVMQGLAAELTYPMVAFNGDLVQFMSGGWISGTAITVHVNGICGALNQRYVFFSLYPEASEFRKHVTLLTYGDDNIGSVDSEHTEFNIKSISRVLAEYGQTYTMPDKTSELMEFLPIEKLEFLKRKSVYHKELGCSTGALVEDSIFKSLHCRVKDKSCPLTDDEAAATNISGALHEFFHHGRETYEGRRVQLRRVAEHHKLTHLVHGLDLDYDDRISLWFFNYGTEEERLVHTARAEIARKRCSQYIDLEYRLDSDSVCEDWEGDL